MRDHLDKVRESGQEVNPLFRYLGITVICFGSGEAVLRLPLMPEFTPGAGLAAGGILATLADEAMAHAARADHFRG